MAKKKQAKSIPKVENENKEAPNPASIEEKKEKVRLLGKIYREYSRRKYNKYKLQFPRLRESDLITKIIK